MKRNFYQLLKSLLRIAERYSRHYDAIDLAVEKTYCRPLIIEGSEDNGIMAIVTISPYGSLLRVSEMNYCNGEVLSQISWVAYRHWYGNCLWEIGGDKICTIDPTLQLLYLEENTTLKGRYNVDIYKEQL